MDVSVKKNLRTIAEPGDVFDIRSANEWMRRARSMPLPKKLFGDLWQEGELAIMFADTGKGKSALAVQIADSITRGTPIYPFEMTAKRQKVLYLDFELSCKQFEMRYTAEPSSEKSGRLRYQYQFSESFKRIELAPETLSLHDGKPFEEAIRAMIGPLIEQSGAKVLIIDNITYLKRTAEGNRETVPLMKELHRLKRKYGISILLVAHTPKRDPRRPLNVNDLQGSKAIANYADNIFAIGQSTHEPADRYIKHIKLRSGEMIYDDSNAPWFRLRKIGGNFLGFRFCGFAAEADLLREPANSPNRALIDKVKALHDSGMNIRAVADELGLSKSTAHRLLHQWRPAPASNSPKDPTKDPNYFPGCEEYNEANDDPRLVNYDTGTTEGMFIMREGYLVQLARGDARTAYKETGKTPRLSENQKLNEFKEAVRVYSESGGSVIPKPISHLIRDSPTVAADVSNTGPQARDADAAVSEVPAKPATPFDDMKRVVDRFGNVRYVEAEYDDGRPRIWYSYRSDGQLLQYLHEGFGSASKNADPERFGKFTKIEPLRKQPAGMQGLGSKIPMKRRAEHAGYR